MQDCIFCKIVDRKIPATIICENDHVLVIQDIAPKAPVHYLIMPKIHYQDLRELDVQNSSLLQSLFEMVQRLAKELPGNQSFNLVSNNGKDAGQSVFHMHWHFLAGRNLWHGNL